MHIYDFGAAPQEHLGRLRRSVWFIESVQNRDAQTESVLLLGPSESSDKYSPDNTKQNKVTTLLLVWAAKQLVYNHQAIGSNPIGPAFVLMHGFPAN